MLRNLTLSAAAVALCCTNAVCQTDTTPVPGPPRTVPVYKVTVVERSLQAVNYQYRSGPTEIDFKGTVLLPLSKGHATVESKRGRTDIEAKFDKLTPPTPFGGQYLTYVLWAISPEGAPYNLGEIIANGSDSARVHVTTDLQAFGLLITAEPYSAVRQPSDVVVMENQVRPDTIGRIEPIVAKAELISRGQFTYDKQSAMSAAADNAPKVSMNEYEQLLEIYQAENALGIARAAGAERLAPDTFNKADAFYREAQRLKDSKAGVSLVVQAAREAAQTADDARAIAVRRAQEDRIAVAQQQTDAARAEADQARADAQRARAEADAARAHAEADRAARHRMEVEAADAPKYPAKAPIAAVPPPPPPAPTAPPVNLQSPQTQTRRMLVQQCKAVAATRDTPRGIVVTLPDAGFVETGLRPASMETVARLVPLLTQPGLRVSVEGYSDSAAGSALAAHRAEAVRTALMRDGLSAGYVSATSFGDSRPLTSNATLADRIENRRVEIVITGNAIGNLPVWDRTYDPTVR